MARFPLPLLPRIVFGVIEPVILLRQYFVNRSATINSDLTGPAIGAVLQLVNLILLLAPISVMCCFSRDPRTVKWYLTAKALADCLHASASFMVFSYEPPFGSLEWNDKVWVNVWGSLGRALLRQLTLLGVFGSVSAEDDGKDSKNGEKKNT
ncbi:hypothetical protein B0J18DRAFT_417035 [Chaetomium sp. MPI-SDFR-AT-0129]|nr:hypothetical protein B0J18DRAFT_417035 [Chaetomium sp. MPI-SDFR-AT-0129]